MRKIDTRLECQHCSRGNRPRGSQGQMLLEEAKEIKQKVKVGDVIRKKSI